MIRILLASHGDFAKGLLETGKMIGGKELMNEITCISLQPNEGITDLEKQAEQYCTQYGEDELLILVDMLGATPFNVCARVFQNCDYRILSGMNLPMLIEAAIHREQLTLDELANCVCATGKDGIEKIHMQKRASVNMNADEEDF